LRFFRTFGKEIAEALEKLNLSNARKRREGLWKWQRVEKGEEAIELKRPNREVVENEK